MYACVYICIYTLVYICICIHVNIIYTVIEISTSLHLSVGQVWCDFREMPNYTILLYELKLPLF